MKLTVNNILEPSLDLGYKICLVGLPEFAKKVTDFELTEAIATETQINDIFGADSIVAHMYKQFREVDVYGEINLNAIAVPDTNSDLTKATKHTITMSGTGVPADDYNILINIADQVVTVAIDSTDGLNNIATAIAAAINANGLTGYTAVANTEIVTLTAKSNNAYLDNVKPIVTMGDPAFVATVATVAATATAIDLDDIGDFLDKKNIKHRLFIMESGLSETALLAKIAEYETMNDKDMQGRYMTTKFDTYSNLIAASHAYNAKSATLIGFKADAVKDSTTDRLLLPYEVTAIFAGLLGVCYTPNANCSKYLANSPIGSLSNARLPLAKCAFDFINIAEGKEWATTEFNNLEDNGVWTAENNAAGNLSIGEYTTTLYLTSEGRPISTFRLGNAAELLAVSMSLHFSILQDNFQHRDLSEDTVSELISTFASIYKTLSGEVRATDGNLYYILDSRGYDLYMSDVKKNMTVNYTTGTVSYTRVRQTLLAQLEKIILNLVSKQYVE